MYVPSLRNIPSTCTMPRETRMPPREELASEILRDRVAFDETRQQALTEELHDRITVPCLERVKGAVVHTIFITETGAENLTKWSGSPEEPAVL